MTAAIDTLAALRKLEKAGFKTEQAEALAEVMAHTGQELATKADLAEAVMAIRQELSLMRWIIGIQTAFVLAMALRVFEIL